MSEQKEGHRLWKQGKKQFLKYRKLRKCACIVHLMRLVQVMLCLLLGHLVLPGSALNNQLISKPNRNYICNTATQKVPSIVISLIFSAKIECYFPNQTKEINWVQLFSKFIRCIACVSFKTLSKYVYLNSLQLFSNFIRVPGMFFSKPY